MIHHYQEDQFTNTKTQSQLELERLQKKLEQRKEMSDIKQKDIDRCWAGLRLALAIWKDIPASNVLDRDINSFICRAEELGIKARD